MIVFDLCCAAGDHRFEAWFASSDGFADQQARGLIACPVCGDSAVKKAAMAPRVGAKSNQAALAPVSKTTDPEPGPELVRKLLAGIAAKQAEMLPQPRTEERSVGKEGVSTCRSGGWADHEKKKQHKNKPPKKT